MATSSSQKCTFASSSFCALLYSSAIIAAALCYNERLAAAPWLRFCCAASPFATVLLAPRLLPLACLTQLQSLHIHAVWKQGIQLKFALTRTMLGIHDLGFQSTKIKIVPQASNLFYEIDARPKSKDSKTNELQIFSGNPRNPSYHVLA